MATLRKTTSGCHAWLFYLHVVLFSRLNYIYIWFNLRLSDGYCLPKNTCRVPVACVLLKMDLVKLGVHIPQYRLGNANFKVENDPPIWGPTTTSAADKSNTTTTTPETRCQSAWQTPVRIKFVNMCTYFTWYQVGDKWTEWPQNLPWKVQSHCHPIYVI